MLEANERRDILSRNSTSSNLPVRAVPEKSIGHLLHSCLDQLPSCVGLLVDMTPKDLERVLYLECFVVTEPGLTPLRYRQLLTEEEYLDAQDEFGEDTFIAQIGAEALEQMLTSLDLAEERTNLRT